MNHPTMIAGLHVIQMTVHRYDEFDELYYVLTNGSLVSASATVANDAKIGFGCRIAESVKLDTGVRLGDFCSLHRDVTVGKDTIIGDNTSVEAETEIGSGVYIDGHCLIGYRNRIPDNSRLSLEFIAPETLEVDGSAERIDRDHIQVLVHDISVVRQATPPGEKGS